MGHPSTPEFQTIHSLRIKGFATVAALADVSALPAETVQANLDDLSTAGLAQFREARALWQLTAGGRTAYDALLATDLAGVDAAEVLSGSYASFLSVNADFKELCGDWQLRDGEINDHTDEGYDGAVINRLVAFDAQAQPILADVADRFDRFAPYGPRLSSVVPRVAAGESNMFTGVMCGSYHDVWMELHEDLILTQGVDRSAEGSF